MIPLHEELKEIRLAKGITLEAIFESTKIRVELLERMEAGDYSIAPDPYIRAFLKEYAVYIGIDPESVIAKLEKKADTVRGIATGKNTPDAPGPDNEKVTSSPEEEDKEADSGSSVSDESEETESGHVNPLESEIDGEENMSVMAETADTENESSPETVSTDEVTESEDRDDSDLPASDEEKTPEISDNDRKDDNKDDESRENDPQQDLFDETHDDSWKPGIEIPAIVEESKPEEQSPPLRQEMLSAGPAMHPTGSRRRLEIDDPDTGGNFLFYLFLIILIIAASVIVWMNRSGMF